MNHLFNSLSWFPVNETGYPAGYWILKKAWYPVLPYFNLIFYHAYCDTEYIIYQLFNLKMSMVHYEMDWNEMIISKKLKSIVCSLSPNKNPFGASSFGSAPSASASLFGGSSSTGFGQSTSSSTFGGAFSGTLILHALQLWFMKYYMPRYYFFLRRGHFGKRSLMRHMRWTLLVAPVCSYT